MTGNGDERDRNGLAYAPDWVYTFRQQRGIARRLPPGAAALVAQLPAYIKDRTRPLLTSTALAALREPVAMGDVVAALAAIPNPDLGWDDWNRIGMAVWASTDGSEDGREAWRTWSRKSRKHRDDGPLGSAGDSTVDERWAHFARSPPGSIGFGTLVYEARMAVPGWDPPSRQAIEGTQINGHATYPPGLGGSTGTVPGLGQSGQNADSNGQIGPVFPDRDRAGRLKATCRNARAAIQMLGISCRYDLFHDRLMANGEVIHQWAGELSDYTVTAIRVAIGNRFNLDPGSQHVHDAAVEECLAHAFHPIKDYLATLIWDGVRRLDTWLTRYLSAPDIAFNRAVSRLSLVAAVRRIMQPGCKFDHIIVLEGPEGRGKSSAIEILAGLENFSDQSLLNVDDRAQQEALSGIWLYEIADLAGHSRAEVERVKAFATRRVDRARPAYGRHRVDRPRSCVLFATTNNDTYLQSQTGNRRFWPITCGRVDLIGLAHDRDQLWAEAAIAERSGEPIILHETLWETATAIQDMRRDADLWDDLLAGDLGKVMQGGNGLERRVSTSEVVEGRLGLTAGQMSGVTAKRVASAMRRLGWDGPKVIRIGNNVVRGYTKTENGKE